MTTLGRLLAATLMTLALTAAPAAAIVGGKDAPPGTYDAVANVSIAGAEGCTGTLIAPDWVLSAGHCGSITGALTGGALGLPIGWPSGAVKVTLGTTKADGTGGQTTSVDRIELSPRYVATNGNDIALLHLAQAATQTPVQIAGAGAAALWQPGTVETIAGFGTTSDGGPLPATMQVAQVPIVSDAACAAAYPSSFESGTQICAGYPQGGTDSCAGDSGGPLFGHDAGGALKLVGATSYGDGCAQAGKYGIYARVADQTLRSFIASKVPGAIDDHVKPAAAASTPPATTAKTVSATPRLLSLARVARGGARVTLSVAQAGRLTLSWRAGAKHASRRVSVKAGRSALLLLIPRSVHRVSITATLRVTGASSSPAARHVFHV
jgi:trypsin